MENVKLPRFSARLKELRKEKGCRQVEMAELLELTETHYQRVEYGLINVSATTLETLADYFEVSTDYLLGRTDVRRTPQEPGRRPPFVH